MDQAKKIKMPAIVCDIDGVVYHGGIPCGNSTKVISDVFVKKFGKSASNPEGTHMPFVFLTNGGLQTEKQKIVTMNQKLGLVKYQKENSQLYPEIEKTGTKDIELKHMIMCHTPVSTYKFKNLENNDPANLDFTVILAAATPGSIQEDLCKNYKINPQNYITIEEYGVLYPEISYFVQHEIPRQERFNWLKRNLLTRFGIGLNDVNKIEQFRQNLKVSTIVTWTWLSQEGLCHQIFSDLIASKDGRALGDRRQTKVDPVTGEVTVLDPQVVDIIANYDVLYGDQWPTPRFGPGSFLAMFQPIFKRQYGYAPEFKVMGKPNGLSYEFAEEMIQKQVEEYNVSEISQYFMVGDSTFSDIQGANRRQIQYQVSQGLSADAKVDPKDKKWVAILVKTGIYNEQNGDSIGGADYVVKDLEAAYEIAVQSIQQGKKQPLM